MYPFLIFDGLPRSSTSKNLRVFAGTSYAQFLASKVFLVALASFVFLTVDQ